MANWRLLAKGGCGTMLGSCRGYFSGSSSGESAAAFNPFLCLVARAARRLEAAG
jgi:hypothetical protein